MGWPQVEEFGWPPGLVDALAIEVASVPAVITSLAWIAVLVIEMFERTLNVAALERLLERRRQELPDVGHAASLVPTSVNVGLPELAPSRGPSEEGTFFVSIEPWNGLSGLEPGFTRCIFAQGPLVAELCNRDGEIELRVACGWRIRVQAAIGV